MTHPRVSTTWRALGLLFLVGLGYLTVLPMSGLDPAPPGLAPQQFSSHRAERLLKELAQEPRTPGSAGHTRARAFIQRQLDELDIEHEVQEAVACNVLLGGLRCARVFNIIGTLPGSGRRSGRAIALSAHYDTVHNSPGASDDGSGVAVLLETARALKHEGPRPNDVLLLFVDVEESGLLGATAFVEKHRRAQDIGALLNFEARGTRGASSMFDISRGDAQLIAALARSGAPVATNSVIALLSRFLPNDTDATIYKKAEIPSLSFGYAEGVEHYHRSTDNMENIDLGGLQHHGVQALAMVRELAHANLGALKSENNAVYLDLFGNYLLHYPVWVALVLIALTVLGLLIRLHHDDEKAPATKRAFFLTLGLPLLAGLAVSPVAIFLASIGRAVATANQLGYFAAVALCLGATTTLIIFRSWTMRFGVAALRLSPAKIVLPTLVIMSIVAPTATHVLTWPTLGFLAGASIGDALERRQAFGPAFLVRCLGAAPTVYFTAYFARLATIMAAAPSGAAIGLSIPTSIGLWSLLVYFGVNQDHTPRLRRAAWFGLGGTILFSLVAGFSIVNDNDSPRYRGVDYLWDADRERGHWLSAPVELDRFTEKFVGSGAAAAPVEELGFHLPVLLNDAPPHPQPGPRCELILDKEDADIRILRLRFSSTRQARRFLLFELSGTPVTARFVNDEAPISLFRFSPAMDLRLWRWVSGNPLDHWTLDFQAPPREGFVLELSVPVGAKPRLLMQDLSDGLAELEPATAKRPLGTYPAGWGDRIRALRVCDPGPANDGHEGRKLP